MATPPIPIPVPPVNNGHEIGKNFANSQGHPHTGITFDSPNVLDLTQPVLPPVPPKPEQPQLPVDDPYRKYRTNQA